uniref:Uncharacterized protein n=1 Tax=Oryza barthii TaxID=65489 RepID=A0A0D3GXD4_9ORYZ
MAPCRQDQPKTIPSLRRGMVRPHNAAPPRPGPPSLLYVRVIHQLILGILLILTVTVDSGSSAATLTSSRSSSSSLCVIWGSIISRSPAGLVTAGLREAGLESSNQILGVLTLSKAMNGQNALHLCVCNLVTGKNEVLPPLPMDCFKKDGVRGYAILTADHRVCRNLSGGYNTFQVLLLSIHHDGHQVYLHRFSSATATASVVAIREIS